MSSLEMPEVAAALPDAAPDAAPSTNYPVSTPAAINAQNVNPREHGWVGNTGYNYDIYTKSAKELMEAGGDANGPEAPVMGVESGSFACNAQNYAFDPEEVGDIGPENPALEKVLYGPDAEKETGINFSAITQLEVTQEGNIRLDPVRKYEDAGLHPAMLKNVQLAGYTVPTPIQQYCLPAIKKGHDIVACAQTGSGKTAAFLVPILSKLMGKAKKLAAPRPNPVTFVPGVTPGVRAEPLVLIVAPTRELATQIFNEARKFCYRTMLRPTVVYGGAPIPDQIRQLEQGCDLLIGTPGRLIDFLKRPHILSFQRLKYMVIDEADEMLHADWEPELKQIMSSGDQEEGNIIYMMFSATFPKAMRDLAKEHLAHDHVRIRVGRAGSAVANIQQDIVWVEPHMKQKCLSDLLLSAPPSRTIIFVNSKRTADEVDDYLFNNSFPCVSIHADRTQREREDCMRAFRSGKAPILIATGVTARGLDVHNVMHVINYDLPSPQYGGIEEYTHRIGRTGRKGFNGLATSFFNDRDADLGEALTKTLLETRQNVPDFLAQYVPEGFDATGDVSTLKFDADSDDGEGEGNDESGGGAWGAEPATGGWGAAAVDNTSPAAQVEAPVIGGWGVPPVAVAAPAAPVASGWGTTAPQAPQPQVASLGAAAWGPTSAQVVPRVSQPAASWGTSTPPAAPQVKPAAQGWGAASPPAPKPAANGWDTAGGW